MAPMASMRKKVKGPNKKPLSLRRKRVDEDLDCLDRKVQELDPTGEFVSFADIPLSQATASGLEASHFKTLTDVQRKAVPLALKRRDILGAAKTGSGKTLAFLVPVLENLYRKRWTELDGLGALILSPTRELAIQIFEVLRKIGRYHTFSAGLVIGGKSLQEERDRLGRMNILVCTPGRMLQHMDQTAAFEIDNLQMLVLDEADRIMDMGFQGTVDAIVEHLPKERQTMLFSATQTKKVSDLARLSLRDPEYISVHETASSATPSTLQQHYIVTPLPEKLNTLWSFIRANLKSKILVFMSSGKQVRFVYESFRHLQPGIPLLHLHGRQKQTARLDITTKFSASKNTCLFTTDVVARGLDFPAVDWVIQSDCPEDADTYIHRVGRTARYERDGRAVLFLEPSEEEGMLKRLTQKKVIVEKINVREKKQQSIQNQLQNMCFKDPELKYLGQKAFVSYVKSVHLQKDKDIFKLSELLLEEYSASLGLPGAPRIKFMKGDDSKKLKNAPRRGKSESDDGNDVQEAEESGLNGKVKKADPVRTKYDRMFERRNQDVLADHYAKLVDDKDTNHHLDADEDNNFLTVKRRLSNASELSSDIGESSLPKGLASGKVVHSIGKGSLIIDSKRREKLLKSKKQLLKFKGKPTKLVYDDDDNPHQVYEFEDENQFQQQGSADTQRTKFLEAEQAKVQVADLVDKRTAKEKRREKREKRKSREAIENGAAGVEAQAVSAPNDPDDVEPGEEITLGHEDLEPKQKRRKKWFEDHSDNDVVRKKSHARQEPENIEDLEALASGLLG